MPRFYQIEDKQLPGRLFADGAKFKNREEIIEQLIDYHSIDFSWVNDKDEPLTMPQYMEQQKIKTTKAQLEFLLEYGEWRIIKGERVMYPISERS